MTELHVELQRLYICAACQARHWLPIVSGGWGIEQHCPDCGNELIEISEERLVAGRPPAQPGDDSGLRA